MVFKKKKVMTKLLLLMYKSGLIYRVYMKEPEENKDTALMKAKQPETSDERKHGILRKSRRCFNRHHVLC